MIEVEVPFYQNLPGPARVGKQTMSYISSLPKLKLAPIIGAWGGEAADV